NAQGRFLDGNPALCRLTGYSVEELRAMPLRSLSVRDPRDGERAFAALERAGNWSGEWEIRRRDGSVLPIEVRMTAVDLPSGRLYFGLGRDLTERKRAEAEREALLAQEREARARAESAEARLRSLFDAAPDGILVVDTEGRYLDGNPAMVRLTG